jgi:cytosine/creatinine deaminase
MAVSKAENLDLVNVRLPLENEDIFYSLSIRNGKWGNIQPQVEYTRSSRTVSIEKAGSTNKSEVLEADVIDAEGKLIFPGFVDAHMHLDKAFALTAVENVSGTLKEAVMNYTFAAPTFTKHEIKSRIMRSALQSLSFGTTHLRTHLDFNVKSHVGVAMRTVEAALEVKEALAPYMTLQLIPMCSNELSIEQLDALEEALRMGVDGLGGAPHLSETPKEHIDFIFRMAMKYDRVIDLHADESDDPAMRTVEHIARWTKEYGLSGRVTVDHLCTLASMPDADAEEIIQLMVDTGLMAVSLPAVNLYLQGRRDSFPVRRGVTRLKELWNAGVPIAIASDNIHDPFHPFGRGDMVQIGLISSYATHMGRPADLRILLRMMTEVPASIMEITDYGIKAGLDASFVVVDCSSPEELFTMLPDRRWVYSRGKWVRMAAEKAGWQDATISSKWEEACEVVSFNKRL